MQQQRTFPPREFFLSPDWGWTGQRSTESKRVRGNCAAPVRHELFRLGLVGFGCAPRADPEICTGEGEREREGTSPRVLKEKGKCYYREIFRVKIRKAR
jgi:hypothetical protein